MLYQKIKRTKFTKHEENSFAVYVLVEVGGRISLSCQIETVNFPAFFYKYSHFEENETRAPSKLVNF